MALHPTLTTLCCLLFCQIHHGRGIHFWKEETGDDIKERDLRHAARPVVELPDASAVVGHLFKYQIPKDIFPGSVDHFKVSEFRSSVLPRWLYFNETTHTLFGVPSPIDQGGVALDVIAVTKEHPDKNISENHQSANLLVLVKSAGFLNSQKQPASMCYWDENPVRGSLILNLNFNEIPAEGRVNLILLASAFLSHEPADVFLSPKLRQAVASLLNEKILASGGNSVENLSTGVELSWPVGCGHAFHVQDFARVLEHNVKTGLFKKVLGYQVISWCISEIPKSYSQNGLLRRKRAIMPTPMQTPTIWTSMPSKLSETYTINPSEFITEPTALDISSSPSSSDTHTTSTVLQPSVTAVDYSDKRTSTLGLGDSSNLFMTERLASDHTSLSNQYSDFPGATASPTGQLEMSVSPYPEISLPSSFPILDTTSVVHASDLYTSTDVPSQEMTVTSVQVDHGSTLIDIRDTHPPSNSSILEPTTVQMETSEPGYSSSTQTLDQRSNFSVDSSPPVKWTSVSDVLMISDTEQTVDITNTIPIDPSFVEPTTPILPSSSLYSSTRQFQEKTANSSEDNSNSVQSTGVLGSAELSTLSLIDTPTPGSTSITQPITIHGNSSAQHSSTDLATDISFRTVHSVESSSVQDVTASFSVETFSFMERNTDSFSPIIEPTATYITVESSSRVQDALANQSLVPTSHLDVDDVSISSLWPSVSSPLGSDRMMITSQVTEETTGPSTSPSQFTSLDISSEHIDSSFSSFTSSDSIASVGGTAPASLATQVINDTSEFVFDSTQSIKARSRTETPYQSSEIDISTPYLPTSKINSILSETLTMDYVSYSTILGETVVSDSIGSALGVTSVSNSFESSKVTVSSSHYSELRGTSVSNSFESSKVTVSSSHYSELGGTSVSNSFESSKVIVSSSHYSELGGTSVSNSFESSRVTVSSSPYSELGGTSVSNSFESSKVISSSPYSELGETSVSNSFESRKVIVSSSPFSELRSSSVGTTYFSPSMQPPSTYSSIPSSQESDMSSKWLTAVYTTGSVQGSESTPLSSTTTKDSPTDLPMTSTPSSIELGPSPIGSTYLFPSIQPSSTYSLGPSSPVTEMSPTFATAVSTTGSVVGSLSTVISTTLTTESLPSSKPGLLKTSTPNTITEPVKITVTPVNSPPTLVRPINIIDVVLGVYFEYIIPDDTFFDVEDGSTEALKLKLISFTGDPLGMESWIQLDTDRHMLYGIRTENNPPVTEDQYILTAEDSGGLVAKDVVKILIDLTSWKDLSHLFYIGLYPHSEEATPLAKLLQVIHALADYFGDDTPLYVTVTDVEEGAKGLWWSNNTLSKTDCDNQTIHNLFAVLATAVNVSKDLKSGFSPRIELLDASIQYRGVCAPSNSSVALAATPFADVGIYYKIFIPICVFLVILLICLLCYLYLNRRQKLGGKILFEDEKPIFKVDRHPILLENELELQCIDNPSHIPHKYRNSAFPYDDHLRVPGYQIAPDYLKRSEADEGIYDELPPPDWDDAQDVYTRPPPMYRFPPPYSA